MEEDKFALVEKIIKDIYAVFSRIAELRSFDIVPVDTNFRNKSPVLYLENCLGLESWCIKHVYMYCYSEIMDRYCHKGRRKVFKVSSVNADRMIKLLNVTLLLNPDLSTLWNKRRMLVEKSMLDNYNELHFTRLVISRKPKCNDAFAYRRWLLDIIFADKSLQITSIRDIINEELNICTQASDRSPNNYHSWNHRMWFVNKLKTLENPLFDIYNQYIKEYNFSEQWTAKNVSDYSCFHYRQFCIRNHYLLNEESWKKFTTNLNLRKVLVKILADNVYICRKLEIIFHELAVNNELIRFYKHHETLWYHRRFIVHEIIEIIYEHFCLTKSNGVLVRNTCKKCTYDEERQKQAKIVRYDTNCMYSSVLFNVMLTHEKKFIEEMRTNLDNYADRHEKYLKFVEGLHHVM
ncbi:PREDICTED: protein prenyltransferase alpha subunit repeat-containing protein 1-A isoform X2 [Papilio xuthus]|uniref:Protein prenyltransferase alpha subunit repeat-containing protein 1-A isoform X2 n=1 Tax=Papilio xuthus TaxID=66420 RepID=A0AAJ6ZD67_PAPXU|nr:PREDICTED: protein prenyltransferase alpha subunit repeat-containing protein 1-A isoform X2 [Papilio xuthus]